jgi:hypothetical protein
MVGAMPTGCRGGAGEGRLATGNSRDFPLTLGGVLYPYAL